MEEAMLANKDILNPHFTAEQIVEGEISCVYIEYFCQ